MLDLLTSSGIVSALHDAWAAADVIVAWLGARDGAVALEAACGYLGPAQAPTTTAQAVLSILLAGELASVVGSWRIGVFEHGYISQAVYACVYLVLALIQGGMLWPSRSGSP